MKTPVLVALLLVLAALLLAIAIGILIRVRRRSGDREQRRRLAVNARGRLGDATITDIADDTIYYSYTVHGVLYEGSQDVSQLRGLIPVETERLIGPALLKYQPRNPANSIVICEEWSGLRSKGKPDGGG
jgi:hypothetical protein